MILFILGGPGIPYRSKTMCKLLLLSTSKDNLFQHVLLRTRPYDPSRMDQVSKVRLNFLYLPCRILHQFPFVVWQQQRDPFTGGAIAVVRMLSCSNSMLVCRDGNLATTIVTHKG